MDIIFGARAQTPVLLEGLLGGLRAHDDQRHVFERSVAFQLVAHREAVHARQLDRKQNQIRLFAGGGLQTEVGIVDHRGLAAKRSKANPQLFGEPSITLEHQNLDRHQRSLVGRALRRLAGARGTRNRTITSAPRRVKLAERRSEASCPRSGYLHVPHCQALSFATSLLGVPALVRASSQRLHDLIEVQTSRAQSNEHVKK